MRPLPHTRSCFVCGELNSLGLKLNFETDGKIVSARFVPRVEHIGFKGVVHGGLLSTVLDEIMVWACAVETKKFAFCAELKVRFLQPAIPGEEIFASGELASNRRNKIFETRAELRNARGEILASATGKYLPIKSGDVRGMLDDLIGDSSWLNPAP